MWVPGYCTSGRAVQSHAELILQLGLDHIQMLPIGRICIAVVWVCHLLYFTLRVKTIKPTEQTQESAE